MTTERTKCAFCDNRATECGLCRTCIKEDQEIQRRNDQSRPRPTWAQKLDADREARYDW